MNIKLARSLKTFLSQIEYPYTNQYYPNTILKMFPEYVLKLKSHMDIYEAFKEYSYIQKNTSKCEQLFKDPIEKLAYDQIEVATRTLDLYNNEFPNRVIITNMDKNFFGRMLNFSVYSLQFATPLDVKRKNFIFKLKDNSNTYLKVVMNKLTFYRNDTLFYTCKLKKKLNNDYHITDESGDYKVEPSFDKFILYNNQVK